MFYILGFFGIIGLVIYGEWKKDNNKKENQIAVKKRVLKKCISIAKSNAQQLARQRKKSSHNDVYGKVNYSQWYEKEIPYFIENHVFPRLNQEELENWFHFTDELGIEIDKIAKKTRVKTIGYDSKMTGFQFEDYCLGLFEKKGWIVSKTKAGADQGVDLIIEKNNFRIGVQCKKYAKPIGNKAVQEIKAGISHYGLNYGIVLTNNKFTTQAIQLAKSNNIGLYHYLDIDKLKPI